jgi:hypothetical protein
MKNKLVFVYILILVLIVFMFGLSYWIEFNEVTVSVTRTAEAIQTAKAGAEQLYIQLTEIARGTPVP